MGLIWNRVVGGDYKGADIKFKMNGKVYLIKKGFFGTTKIDLCSKTVQSVKILSEVQNPGVPINSNDITFEIIFKDGKKSVATTDAFSYQQLLGRMYDNT